MSSCSLCTGTSAPIAEGFSQYPSISPTSLPPNTQCLITAQGELVCRPQHNTSSHDKEGRQHEVNQRLFLQNLKQ